MSATARIFAAALASAGSLAQAASWSIAPRASMGSLLADNPRLVPSDSDAYETGVIGATSDLGIVVSQQSERGAWTLSPAATFLRYQGQDELDADNQRMVGSASLLGERFDWKVDLEGLRDTTLTSERGTTGLTQTNERHERVVLGLGPEIQLTTRLASHTRFGVQFDRYPVSSPAGLSNYRLRRVDERLGYRLTERAMVDLRAAWSELRRSGDDDRVGNTSLSAALRRQMTERWELTLAAGPSRTTSDDGSEDGVIFDLDTRRAGERTDLWARVGRSVIPNGRGTLARSDQLAIGLDHRLSSTISAGVSGQWNRNRDLTRIPLVGERESRIAYWAGAAQVTWAFHPEWSASLSLRAQHQETGYQDQATLEADGYSSNIGVTWTGRSWLPR